MEERGSTPSGEVTDTTRSSDLSRLFDDRGIVAGIVAGLAVLVVDKVLLIDKVMENLPFYDRVLVLGAIIAFAVVTARTFGILAGADPTAPDAARRRFEVFHRDLVEGGTPAKTYNRWLARLLDTVDRFFGDAGRNESSRFARLVGLETPGPRWTAIAYDRCLLLALVYPIVVVLGVWIIFGRVGPVEAALGLRPSASGSMLDTALRGGPVLLVIGLFAAAIGMSRTEGRVWHLWAAAFIVFLGLLVGLAMTVAVIGAGAGAGAGVVVVAGAGAVAGAVAGAAVVAAVVAGDVAVAVAVAGVGAVAVAVAGAAVVAVQFPFEWSKERGLSGPFLVGFSVVMFAVLLGLPLETASSPQWHGFGALCLFYGLFTLVNAPIDWIALGVTRALLRKGLQKQGWWPFAFALVDLVAAAGLVALLAFALVFAVQFFDDMAVLGGGPDARILPVPRLLAELRAAPAADEHWWVWAMLFSSMIPSFVNLTIASAAFLRGLPIVNARVLSMLAAGSVPTIGQRFAISVVLSGQIAVGALLGAAALVFAAELLLPMIFGPFADTLLSFSELLADADLPAQLLELVGLR